ncbi:MAG: transposase, partial [Acidobacteria bacterium]
PLEVAAVVARLVRWLRRPQDRTLRRASVGWLTRVLLPSRLGGVVIPEARNLEELRTMLEERVLQWTEEWKQQGLQEGRRVGLREGLKQSEELLLRQLQLKFGPLDDEVRARVAAADGDERLLSARTLDEVFD